MFNCPIRLRLDDGRSRGVVENFDYYAWRAFRRFFFCPPSSLSLSFFKLFKYSFLRWGFMPVGFLHLNSINVRRYKRVIFIHIVLFSPMVINSRKKKKFRVLRSSNLGHGFAATFFLYGESSSHGALPVTKRNETSQTMFRRFRSRRVSCSSYTTLFIRSR